MTTQSNELNEVKPFHPGAARFGNFINYYNFNSVSKRLNPIPSEFISNLTLNSNSVLCLDIGCNSGELTSGLYTYLVSNAKGNAEIFILGIDLDDVLITRCNESNPHPNNITFQQIDIMEETAMTQLKSFLDAHKRSEFDLVTCFSTTMWIHLNHGDMGLDRFLKKISTLSRFFILEPQEWKSYKSAVRRMTRLETEVFELDKLKIRDISSHVSEFLRNKCGMDSSECWGVTSWGRNLYMFHKRCYK
ncbi:hypothetical protein JTE90_010714 [Oedothorax gibbosus]|uniref:RNA methyltransferase n=1 Tax=Oedothorax gibbosus TaxID=931172 RepID=A0AAV6UPC0_9ARAC|nr:hypothetical protein JTE90_010714 [Oedothorax gibbosus]